MYLLDYFINYIDIFNSNSNKIQKIIIILNFQNGSVVGPLLIAPILGLAIYGFDFAADIPMFMYGLMKSSFMRVGVVSLIITVFGYDREQMTCPDVYCHFDDPKVMLRFLRIEKVNLWNEIAFLVMFAVVFRTIFYLNLRRRVVC